jgi:hypothetical protein
MNRTDTALSNTTAKFCPFQIGEISDSPHQRHIGLSGDFIDFIVDVEVEYRHID